MESGVVKRVIRRAALVFSTLLAGSAQADWTPPPDPRAVVELSGGAFDIFDHPSEPLRFGAEYVSRPFSPWFLTAGVGVTVLEGGANFAYVDLHKDCWIDPRWIFTVHFGAGLFHDGGGPHLGSEAEFRTGLAITRVLGDHLRIGIGGYHLSNGGLSDHNPGTEVAVLLLAFPIGKAADAHGT
jgi:lipid A 3-O-deacylase